MNIPSVSDSNGKQWQSADAGRQLDRLPEVVVGAAVHRHLDDRDQMAEEEDGMGLAGPGRGDG